MTEQWREFRALGERAVLVDCGDPQARRRLMAALATHEAEGAAVGVVEVVPASVTVAVRVAEAASVAAVVEWVRGLPIDDSPTADEGDVVVIGVHYTGEDLPDVAREWGCSTDEVIAWHTSQVWTCDFTGFMPGFGYLVAERPRSVPRRASPRPRIAAGSVGLAGEFAGVYPGASPGGWQVIGTTEVTMFEPSREPAALLRAGTRVRFEPVTPRALVALADDEGPGA